MTESLEADFGSIHVTLFGQPYVWLKNRDGTGAIAYPHHIDDNGDVLFCHVLSESFAHVLGDGSIYRYGSKIGTVDDLQPRSALSSAHHEDRS